MKESKMVYLRKKERKKRSIFWTIPKEELAKIVNESNSLVEVARRIGKTTKGGSFFVLKNRLEKDNIDFSHIALGCGHNKGKKFPFAERIPLEEIMVENSTFHRGHLKERLIKEGIMKYECECCGNCGEWNGKKLVLHLDHKDGNGNNNKKENLRFLCPNCHSQTETYSRNNKYIRG